MAILANTEVKGLLQVDEAIICSNIFSSYEEYENSLNQEEDLPYEDEELLTPEDEKEMFLKSKLPNYYCQLNTESKPSMIIQATNALKLNAYDNMEIKAFTTSIEETGDEEEKYKLNTTPGNITIQAKEITLLGGDENNLFTIDNLKVNSAKKLENDLSFNFSDSYLKYEVKNLFGYNGNQREISVTILPTEEQKENPFYLPIVSEDGENFKTLEAIKTFEFPGDLTANNLISNSLKINNLKSNTDLYLAPGSGNSIILDVSADKLKIGDKTLLQILSGEIKSSIDANKQEINLSGFVNKSFQINGIKLENEKGMVLDFQNIFKHTITQNPNRAVQGLKYQKGKTISLNNNQWYKINWLAVYDFFMALTLKTIKFSYIDSKKNEQAAKNYISGIIGS